MNNDKNAVRRFGHYEQAARAYCKQMDLDPEQRLEHGAAEFSDSGPGFYHSNINYTARWLFVARKLSQFFETQKDEDLMRSAINAFPPAKPSKALEE